MNSDPILVIGTSSPAGACADRDWQKWGIKNTLPNHDRWTSLMEKDPGIKVINLIFSEQLILHTCNPS